MERTTKIAEMQVWTDDYNHGVNVLFPNHWVMITAQGDTHVKMTKDEAERLAKCLTK